MISQNRIYVDLKKIEYHLSVLRNELKETIILIEMLTTIYHTTNDCDVIMKRLRFMETEKKCIQRRILLLENSINKFLDLRTEINGNLDDAMDILNFTRMSFER